MAESTEIHHLNDIPWWNAPVPTRWHFCTRQTWGYIDWLTYIERCVCGAIRRDNDKHWMNRNERRKEAS